MKPIVFAILGIILISSGCLNLYSDVVNANCLYDNDKYSSSYEKIDCLGEKSRYLAAFGEKEQALGACRDIKTNFMDPRKLGLVEGTNFNIFPSHAVTMYNNCLEEVAVASIDESICSQQAIPNVFAAIGDAFSAFPVMDSMNQQHYKGCVDKVEFKKSQLDLLPNMMGNFLNLRTTKPTTFK